MIGMPRMRLTAPFATVSMTRMPDTRISAQTSPRSVDRTSEPMVTRIVSLRPCIRIGRNSAASLKNDSMRPHPEVGTADLVRGSLEGWSRRRSKRVVACFEAPPASPAEQLSMRKEELARASVLEAPFGEDAPHAAVLLQLRKRRVDALQ